MEIVIISRKRPHICADTSCKIFPSAKVSIAEEEVQDYYYAGVDKKKMLVHPNDVVGVCKKRNWVLKKVADEVCVLVDDDCEYISCMVGERYRRLRDPSSVIKILENSESCARAIGAKMFCFNQQWDIRKFDQFKPFSFIGYPSGIVGIIGREILYDENQMLHDDVDFALQQIQRHRVVWVDDRFGYVQKIQTTKMAGGCQGIITAARDRNERMYLKRKWGPYYKMGAWGKIGVQSHIAVKRQQSDVKILGE